jgi:hypothetical protein
MRETHRQWKPIIFTNRFIFIVVPVLVTVGNGIVIVAGATPKAPGTIPRYWWPVCFLLIETASFLYWAVLILTEVKVPGNRDGRTFGDIIGFKAIIYHETDETLPENMEEAMVMSRLDGSRRRLAYEFDGVFKFIGHASLKTWKFIKKYMY